MKCVALLVGLFVLAFGAETVAQAPSPQPMSLYAPEDVAALLPTRVGEVDLFIWDEVDVWDGDFFDATRFWAALLERSNTDAPEIRAAGSLALPTGASTDTLPFVIWAFRIDGVPAATWAESYLELAVRIGDPDGEAKYEVGWRSIDGRHVMAAVWPAHDLAQMREVVPDWHVPDDTGHWMYPVGEVLFAVTIPFDWPVPPPTIADVLAELPRQDVPTGASTGTTLAYRPRSPAR